MSRRNELLLDFGIVPTLCYFVFIHVLVEILNSNFDVVPTIWMIHLFISKLVIFQFKTF